MTVQTFRLPDVLAEEVSELVEEKLYKNKTDFMVTAVRQLLEKEERKQRVRP